jgi:uncharacterized protein with FMN-binding domain
MRRVIFAAASTVVGLIMLLSFKTRATPVAVIPGAPGTGTGTSTTSGQPDATSGSTGTGAGAGATPSTAATAGTKTVTGTAASTRYGPVQVQISVTDGQVTNVDAVVYPTESRRDAQINAYAIPQLNAEAVAAKSAKIDMISGATYTSTGYITSLQSALSKAGVA